MGLREAIALKVHTPTVKVMIDGRQVRGTKGRIHYSLRGNVISSAEITLKTRPSWLNFGQKVTVDLGWNGYTTRRFTGWVEEDLRKVWPYQKRLVALGPMRKAQRKSWEVVTYSNQSARAIITDLLARAGITQVNIGGDDTTLATVESLVLAIKQSYWDLISQIDEPWSCRTFDWLPDGTVRRMTVTGLPTAAAAWSYVYPGNVLEVDRPLSVAAVQNRVEVTGLDGVSASRRADSTYIASGHDEVKPVDSDLIEDNTVAAAVAELWMPIVNRLQEEVRIRVAGNPLLHPGDTINLTANVPGVGIPSTNFWLDEIDDEWTESSYHSVFGLLGGLGDEGYPLPYPPIASFSYKIFRETFDYTGEGAETYYVVTCDGSGSSDPQGLALTYAWENNKNAATGTAVTYSTLFTVTEFADGPTITLEVSNGTDTDTLTLDITEEGSEDGKALVRDLYSAESVNAASTPDDGATWNVASPALSATVTPEIAADTHSYFDDSTTGLYYTGDHLATPPTLVHTFPANITAVSICDGDSEVVAVGLANGDVWLTRDASLLASATWTKVQTNGSAVNWVTVDYTGQVWYLVGADCLVDGRVIGSLDEGYTAKRLALSFFGNYFSGDNGITAQVKRVSDGFPLTWPIGYAPAKCLGLSHDIKDDILYAADELGHFYEKLPGATAFTYVSDIGGGEVRHLIRDGDCQQILYAWCANGIYKSFDRGRTWYQMRACDGRRGGYGSAPISPPEIPLTGKRVYVGGAGGKVFWCDNVFATTPAWSDISTGLPAKYITSLKLDPRDATWNSGYCIAGDGLGGNYLGNAALYYNPALRTGGAWSCVLNKAIVESYVGALDDVQVRAFDVTPTGDIIYANVWASLLGHDSIPNGFDKRQWLFHSHDHGATWTVTAYGPAYGFWVGNGGTAPVIALQRVANAAMFAIGYNGAPVIYRTTDGGHTIQTCGSLAGTGCIGIDCFRIPGTGNDSEQEIILVDGIQADNGTYRTTNFGTSWAAYKKNNYGMNFWQPNDGNIVWAFEIDFDRNVYKSTDRGLSFTAQGVVGIGANRDLSLFGKADGTARLYMVGSPDAEHDDQIQTSEDGTTWTVRVGDMARLTLATITVDPSV